MKLIFKKLSAVPYSELIIYNSLNRIPFTLKLNNAEILPETIYSRNLSGENFLEYRFDKATKQLYEITLVTIQNDTIVKLPEEPLCKINDFFTCYIDEDCELNISLPIQILRSNNLLSFIWSNKDLDYYPIAENCIVGVDINNNLCYVSLKNLNEDLIFDIIGF